MGSELKLKRLVGDDKVYFDWRDSKAPTPGQSYGRAEFIICPIWKRRRLVKFFIYPAQQRDVEFYYEVECDADSLSIQSWTHKELENPKIWLSTWCKEHKTATQRFYVPANSTHFSVQTLSTAGICFGV